MGFGTTGIASSVISLFQTGLISWKNTKTTKKYTAKGISVGAFGYSVSLTDDKTGYVFPKGDIKVNVKVQEVHKFSNEVTSQTMEDGSIVSEHVINNPMEVTIQFEETNTASLSGIVGTVTSLVKGEAPLSTFEKLRLLWEYKIPLTITTNDYQYDRMQIVNMPIVHRAPYKGALQIVCDLKQMNYSKISAFSYKSANEGTNKSASETASGGLQKTTEFDASMLRR